MTAFRKLIYYFVGSVTFLVLLFLPFAFATSVVLGDPETVGTTLKESGAYTELVPILVDNISKDNTDSQTQKLLADPKIQEAITSSITPADVETSAQSLIAGVYSWLEGKTALPEFTIDLTRSSTELTQKLSAYAQERSAALPPCTINQLQTVDFQSDVLSIPCLPPGVTPEQVGQQFAQQAASQVEFLKNPVISDETLIKEADRRQAEQDAASVPTVYQNLHNAKWYALGLAVLLTMLLVLGRRDKRAGIRYVGILLLSAGLFVGLIALIVSSVNGQIADADKIATLVLSFAATLTDMLTQIVRWFAIGYVAAGILILLYLMKFGPAEDQTTMTSTDPITRAEP